MPTANRPAPQFRDYQAADHASLEAMILALYADDPGGETVDADKIRRTVSVLQQRPDLGRILMIWMAEQIIGYSILIRYWSNEYGGVLLNIDELYLLPEWRGQGIASEFLSRVAPTLEPDTVGLQLEVTPDNHQAQALYRRLGFRADINVHLLTMPQEHAAQE